MATQAAPDAQQQPTPGGRVTALDTTLVAGTVAAASLAPVAISVATPVAALVGIKKAAEALAIGTTDAGDHAANLILDALPEAPPARGIDRALMRRRALQFRVESVKRVVKGAREAFREPTRKQVVRQIQKEVKATHPAKTKRLTALAAAIARAQSSPSPRQLAMRKVFEKEGRYAAQHVAAQVARADGAARQAILEVESPDGAIWRTAQDDRVTPDCAALDGKPIPHSILRIHRPPLHAGCRCTLEPHHGEVLSHEEARDLLDHALSLKEDDRDFELTVAVLHLAEATRE